MALGKVKSCCSFYGLGALHHGPIAQNLGFHARASNVNDRANEDIDGPIVGQWSRYLTLLRHELA